MSQGRDFLLEDNGSPSMNNLSGRDFLLEDQPQQESFGTSAALAVPRIATDLAKGAYHTFENIPEYYKKFMNAGPQVRNAFSQDPNQAAKQGLAGFAEAGQNIFNFPHDIANYATNRLNLLPQNINEKIQMARMPNDTKEMINQTLGAPQNPGEESLRWGGRNAINLMGATGIARTLNPLNITNRGIARNVVAEQNRQIAHHTNMYNNLWRDAERAGINEVPINQHLVQTNLDFIRQYKSPRDYRTLEYFNEHPTLPNAQAALSDLRTMRRKLDEKSRTNSLTGEERNLYDALEHTEQHIEHNMFRNPNGSINNALANRYRTISHSYRENVVPYRYNKDIQAYINREITAKQLRQRLSEGEFAVKKGGRHPAISIRNALPDIGKGLGIGAGIGGTTYGLSLLSQYLNGNQEQNR